MPKTIKSFFLPQLNCLLLFVSAIVLLAPSLVLAADQQCKCVFVANDDLGHCAVNVAITEDMGYELRIQDFFDKIPDDQCPGNIKILLVEAMKTNDPSIPMSQSFKVEKDFCGGSKTDFKYSNKSLNITYNFKRTCSLIESQAQTEEVPAKDVCFCFSDIPSQVGPGQDLTDKIYFGCPELPGPSDTCEAMAPRLREIKENQNKINIVCESKRISQLECYDKISGFISKNVDRTKAAIKVQQNLGFLGRATPPCAFQDLLVAECRDISVFVLLIIDYSRGSLAIIGAFALAYFMYGGFMLILSQGSADKVKKGTDAMLAALIGLFIVFIAYIFIRFMGEKIGVKPDFNLLP